MGSSLVFPFRQLESELEDQYRSVLKASSFKLQEPSWETPTHRIAAG
jgi:hypothetical protein